MAVSFERIQQSSASCPICLDNMEGDGRLLGHVVTPLSAGSAQAECVQHVFHQICVSGAFEQDKKCPLCRQEVSNANQYMPRSGKELIEAARQGLLEEVQAILGSRLTPIPEADYVVALAACVRLGHANIVEALLAQRIQIPEEQLQPLIILISKLGHLGILKLFFNYGIQISKEIHRLAITQALRANQTDIVRELQARRAYACTIS